jgi:hypothetical protein
MLTPLRLSLLGAAGSFVLSTSVFAAGLSSWPMWRGATGDGVARDAKPPTTWSDQQNLKWKTKIPGYGFSTPIIWQDRIYLLSAIETTEELPGAATPAPEAPPPGPEQKTKKRGGFGRVQKVFGAACHVDWSIKIDQF